MKGSGVKLGKSQTPNNKKKYTLTEESNLMEINLNIIIIITLLSQESHLAELCLLARLLRNQTK